jgi:hypothetical protein
MICRSNKNQIKLVVLVRAHWSMPDCGPKCYRHNETLSTFVDRSACTFLEVVNFIAESFIWGSRQYISLSRALEEQLSEWFQDGSIEIESNEQLQEWFEVNKDKGEACISAEIKNFEGPLQCSPTKRRLHPTVRSLPSTAPIDLDPFIDPKQCTQPTQPTKKDKKVDSKVSYDVLSDSSYDSDLAASSDSELDTFSDSDCSNIDYDPSHEMFVDDDNDDEPFFSYDVDAPSVDVGCIFRDVKECKSALTQHAILNDYAYRTVKKDLERFRAKCLRANETGCQWTFFANTSKAGKYVGCKV